MRAGVKVVWIALAGLCAASAGPAWAQEACADRLDGIEAALADVDLPGGQRQDIDKVLQGARDLAAAGEQEGCQRTAETLDQLRASLTVTGEVEGGTPGQATPPSAGDRPAGAQRPTETGPEGGLTASEAEELIGRQVVDRGGNQVGELVDVARLRGRDQAFAAIRHGGLLGFGERNTMVMLTELEHGEAGEVVLSRTAAGVLEELPEYDRVTFESVTGRLD
jgi:hypothetical protein